MLMQVTVKVTMFDRIKNYYMPLETKKYRGYDYYARIMLAGVTAQLFSTFLLYPMDVIVTRM